MHLSVFGIYLKSKLPKRVRLTLGLALILLKGLSPAAASTTTTTLVPFAYKTTHGADGGQPVTNLDLLDESGLSSDPSKFVEFEAKTAGTTYAGYQSFTLPASVSPASVTSIQLQVNYQGPAPTVQAWTWQIFDWVHNAYMAVGYNYAAPEHGPWTILSFNISGNNLANYVRASDGQVQVQLISNNSADNVDMDYEALVVTSTSTPFPAPAPFYVATTGNDQNPGTINAPWKTISKAANTVGPGSTVYVRSGVYHERVVVNVSGSASGGYIQFQSYPSENAIIDGTGVSMPPAGNTPTGLFQVTNQNYVIVEGFEIRNFTSNSSNLFPAGISITGACAFIQVVDNRIHAINNGVNGAHGLGVYGTGAPNSINNLVIDGNQLYNLTLGQSESMEIGRAHV